MHDANVQVIPAAVKTTTIERYKTHRFVGRLLGVPVPFIIVTFRILFSSDA